MFECVVTLFEYCHLELKVKSCMVPLLVGTNSFSPVSLSDQGSLTAENSAFEYDGARIALFCFCLIKHVSLSFTFFS